MNSKFYIFGDSICFGQHISLHSTWAVQISNFIFTDINPNCVLQNASINGNTTDMAMIRFQHDIISHTPEYLMIQFGMNDCNYWETDGNKPRVDPIVFKNNLTKFILDAFKYGAKHIFLNTNHSSLKGEFRHLPGSFYQDSNALYNQIIRQVFEEFASSKSDISMIDLEQEFNRFLEINKDLTLADLLLPDGIHLSKIGHDLYYKIISHFLLLNKNILL